MNLTRRTTWKWIIDFGSEMQKEEAAFYEVPFAHVEENVKPARQQNRNRQLREFWWRHGAPRPGMWKALKGLRRYIATPTVSNTVCSSG